MGEWGSPPDVRKFSKLNLDFLVIEAGDELRTVQAIVHTVEGEKRPYDLETEN